MRIVLTTLLMLNLGALAPAEETSPRSFYTVEDYDWRRDPLHDLAETLKLARRDEKTVLVQVGGNWCGWCHILERTFRQNERVANALGDEYLVMKINVSHENPNEQFLSQLPPIQSYPHLFAFNADGALVGSQDASALESARGYSERAILALLKLWAPERDGSPQKTQSAQSTAIRP